MSDQAQPREIGAKPSLKDRTALWLLKLAKFRQARLRTATPVDNQQFYAKFFQKKDVESFDRDIRMRVRRETITACFGRLVAPGAGVLDVGCGLGDVLHGLPKSYRLHGMDFARENVDASRALLGQGADIRQGSIYEIPFDTASMDACLCLEVLEHIEDDAKAVREIARVLRPGGVLVASVPYTFYWPEYLPLIGHYRHYTRESFGRLLENAGLRVREHLPNFPRWHQEYTRRYALLRAVAETLGRLWCRRGVYSFKWPFSRECAVARLERRMQPTLDRDRLLPYAQLPTSTFIVAEKP